MNRKISLLLAVFSLISFPLLSQSCLIMARPEGSKEWGYINQKGDLVIKPQYRTCDDFSAEGLAPIYDKGSKSYYFINAKGEKLQTEVSDFKLKNSFGFSLGGYSNGMVAIEKDGKWGYLTSNGKLAIAPKYDYASPFSEGAAIVRIGDRFLIIDKSGKETPINIADFKDVNHFENGLAPLKRKAKKMAL